MDQFALIPQQLFDQKIRLSPQRLDKYNEKQDSVPKNLETVYRKVNAKTKSSSKESLINEILNSPRIQLSLSDSILLDGRDTNVSFVDFVNALKRKNVECPDIYYTILDAIGLNPHKNINKDAKAKNEEAGSLSKSEKAKLQRLYREGKAAYGSVQNFQKASGLSKKKVTDFLYRKYSYTKFRQAI